MNENKCNTELLLERQKSTFDTKELTYLLDGGKEKTKKRHDLENYFLSDPELQNGVVTECLSHEERYNLTLKTTCQLFQKALAGGDNGPGEIDTIRSLIGSGLGYAVIKDGNPLSLHFVMFIPTLIGQGTVEQQLKWLGRAWNMEIIGTYAQTELGHGTFIRGLETTATYDPETEEFVLHSPTLTSLKWWPGGLGKTANYAVVMAQLYSKGQHRGIHPFFVQLRDEETHQPCPGIKVGEIGPKLGLHTTDNGFLGFDNYRIPRTNMLMKHSRVLQDGTYIEPVAERLNYGTMVFVRVAICMDVVMSLKRAAIIATRYSAVRRQSEIIPGEPEPQIIDYQTQQMKVFPVISMCFAFHFAAQSLWDIYNFVSHSMDQGDLELLPELHALACGLKALVTSQSAAGVETCRLSCGGHGYMACSNFPRLFGIVTAACTYEGENTVLWLQVARYLMKSYREALTGKPVNQSVAYLSCSSTSFTGHLNLDDLLKAYQLVASGLIKTAAQEYQHKMNEGMCSEEAWNLTSAQLVQCAKAHCQYFVVQKFTDAVKVVDVSQSLRQVLTELCELHTIYGLMQHTGDFLRYGKLEASHISKLQQQLERLLLQLRPNAVSLVDAFDIRDEMVNSALGAWDGQVYERLYKEALKSPLNKTDVPEAFHKYLKPLMKSNL